MGVTRAHLSQSREAPPRPVLVPASMMPGAARVRIVWFRTRAPLSLRFREYPRERRPSMSEILQLVTELGTIVKRASLYKRQKSLMQTGRPQGRHDLPMHSEIKNQRSSPARPFLLASVRHALSFGRL